jgi:hypothetical protein
MIIESLAGQWLKHLVKRHKFNLVGKRRRKMIQFELYKYRVL